MPLSATCMSILKKMPPEAKRTAIQLVTEWDSHHAGETGRWNQSQHLYKEILELEGIIAQNEANGQDPDFIESQKEELAALREQHKQHQANAPTPPYPKDEHIEREIRKIAGRKFELYLPDVKVPKGKTALEALDAKRDVIANLKAEAESFDKARLTFDEAFRQAERDIQKLAASGAPDFRGTTRLEPVIGARVDIQGETRWPMTFLNESRSIVNGGAMIAWLFKDELIARARMEIQAATREGTISLADRKARRREIAAEIIELEREEEVLFRLARKEDKHIQRRHGASMFAILQLREATKN